MILYYFVWYYEYLAVCSTANLQALCQFRSLILWAMSSSLVLVTVGPGAAARAAAPALQVDAGEHEDVERQQEAAGAHRHAQRHRVADKQTQGLRHWLMFSIIMALSTRRK